MKWLLTIPADADLATLQQELESVGAALESEEPVSLGEQEQVVYADGPDDLSERLSATNMPVHVYPNSDLQLY